MLGPKFASFWKFSTIFCSFPAFSCEISLFVCPIGQTHLVFVKFILWSLSSSVVAWKFAFVLDLLAWFCRICLSIQMARECRFILCFCIFQTAQQTLVEPPSPWSDGWPLLRPCWVRGWWWKRAGSPLSTVCSDWKEMSARMHRASALVWLQWYG